MAVAKLFVLHANAVNFASPSKNTVEKNDEKKRMTNCKAFCATRKRKKGKTVAKPFALHANAKKKKIMTITKFFALHAKAINIFKLKKDFVIYFFKVKNELTRSCRLNHIMPKLLIITKYRSQSLLVQFVLHMPNIVLSRIIASC